MLDRARILGKIDELDLYLDEIRQILPTSFKEYKKIEKRRACERLLQLSIECVIDICKLFVAGLRLGLPGIESDLFDKMKGEKIVSTRTHSVLKEMKGLRNILVHEYADVDDEIVFSILSTRMPDLMKFKKEVLNSLAKK